MLTVGSKADPYDLARREAAKLLLVAQDYGVPPKPVCENKATINTSGDYTGLTDSELMKLQQGQSIYQKMRQTNTACIGLTAMIALLAISLAVPAQCPALTPYPVECSDTTGIPVDVSISFYDTPG